MSKKKGMFITLEGLDGCGKTVIGGIFAETLEKMGYQVVKTREPGGSILGQGLREMLLHYKEDNPKLTNESEALLFLADRAQHVHDVIMPALAKGSIVICDRYADSTLAYQGGGRGMDIGILNLLNDFASRNLKPDLTFYLHTPQEVSEIRRTAAADRMEKEDREFFRRVEAFYDRLAEKERDRVLTVDANRDRYIVAEEMTGLAEKRLNAFDLEKKIF